MLPKKKMKYGTTTTTMNYLLKEKPCSSADLWMSLLSVRSFPCVLRQLFLVCVWWRCEWHNGYSQPCLYHPFQAFCHCPLSMPAILTWFWWCLLPSLFFWPCYMDRMILILTYKRSGYRSCSLTRQAICYLINPDTSMSYAVYSH